SWNDLAALFLPLFEKASEIPAASPLRAEVARIKAASADPIERTELALQLVEEKIRYVNLALGVGGLVPSSAEQTWSRRFGDCKAKSALLVGLLRELGIEAVPVLVHSSEGDGLNDRLPMVSLFNHVVVRAIVGGQSHWLDGTRSGDSRLATLEVPFYHWGLPIVRDADLVRIMPDPATRPMIDTVVRTDASAGADKPVPTTIDITMRGDLAIAQNFYLSTLDPAVREDAIRKQLQQELDRFDIDKVSTSYDRASQAIKLHGEGRQTLDLNKGAYWSEVPSLGYKADFRRSGTRDADAPVQIAYPTYSRYVQVIVIPKDRDSQVTFQVAPIAATVAGMEYRRNVTNAGGVVTIEATRRALKPEISFAEAVAAQDRLRALDKDDIWIRLSDSAPVAIAEVKELIGREPKTSNDYFDAAMKLLNKDETEQALGALNKAIEMAPSNTAPRSLRAQMRISHGDLAGAQADAEATLKITPNDVAMRVILAELLRRAGKTDAAYAQAQSLARLDTATAQVSRGEILLSLDRTSEALAAFDRALTYEKDPMTYVHRAQALPPGDKEARRHELDAALKLGPSDPPALVGLAQIASQLGDHAQALALLDQAFLKSPDDVGIRHARAVEMMLAGKKDPADREFDALLAKDLTAPELNNMCWAKALANVALDRALDECNRSLAKDESSATHDSKATVLLRQSRLDDAIKEYDLAMKSGEFASPLYGRSLAYARKGDRAKSDADAAKALQLAPGIDRTYGYFGLSR
ncbi:MAG TPA: tetratricopeptide repeat protein, partial [Sphingomicrobium sp.]|nr:tetratricopeptide repeat protein [Sphingomicrobium sp.]